jgi:Mg/Co/Ni transporter MgtE
VTKIIPQDQREEVTTLLKKKMSEIGRIVEGKYLKINEEFKRDVDFVFGEVKIKEDITYYKYKVINGA